MQDRDLLTQFLGWLRQQYLLAAIKTQEGPLGHSQRVLVVESVANETLIDQYVRERMIANEIQAEVLTSGHVQ